MNPNVSAIQYMGMIMRLDTLNIDYVLSLVEIVNNSYLSAKDVVTILEQIFKNEKSAKILLGTQVLQYLVKNSNRNFHQAANKQSFQKSVLGLLKRQRGKMNIIKQLRSNTENWSRIQSRILYLVQLWYDAFILEQSKYPNIINVYKVLRKQNVVFPPRNVNQRSLLAVQTQSPIFDNIQSIAQADKEKFKKKLKAMGLSKLSEKFEQKQKMAKNLPIMKQEHKKQVNIDEISEKIAIIQSQDYQPRKVLKIIQEVKSAMEHAKVKPNQQKYWKQVKEAGELMIAEWEQKNAQLIQSEQQKYLQQKMFGGEIKKSVSEENKSPQKRSELQKRERREQNTWDLLGECSQKKQVGGKNVENWGDFMSNPAEQAKKNVGQINLLDL